MGPSLNVFPSCSLAWNHRFSEHTVQPSDLHRLPYWNIELKSRPGSREHKLCRASEFDYANRDAPIHASNKAEQTRSYKLLFPFLRRFQVQVSCDITLPTVLRTVVLKYDLAGCSVTAIVGTFRDLTDLHFAPSPPADKGWPTAGTMQCVFIRTSKQYRYQVRPIEIRAEGH
jgi:hypothetical protein